ncbi:tyrosine-type recombinase/integrase [Ectobacillus panaciterrae]|uniref:tyrosine-type recombinase/integrase n=1 Tax=Ectobacillus panaciterrae TaxID=363872 RepID=UPI0003FB96E7|nr:tyrosine-type recombinase/integrase [Ectobacillus panaciterrae]
MESNEDFFNMLTASLSESGKSENTVTMYINDLRRFDEWLQKRDSNIRIVNRKQVQQYILYLESLDHAATTIERIYYEIKTLAKYMKDDLSIVNNIRYPKKQESATSPRCLSNDEVKKLFSRIEHEMSCKSTAQIKKDEDLRKLALLAIMFGAGLRVAEVAALNIKDVDLRYHGDGGIVIVHKGKGNKAREVPIAKKFTQYIEQYLKSRDDENEALFITRLNRRISTRYIQYTLKEYGIHPTMARRTYLTALVTDQGIDLVTAAHLAGHSSVNTTQKYVKPKLNSIYTTLDKLYE